ncbi:MAG: DUF1616 domain-containing protein, partial [Candidatus Thorarchaeota archaeon]
MSKIINTIKKKSIKKQFKGFEKVLTFLLIVGILFISSFIVYVILTPEPGYITMGILNSDKKAEDYPTNANVGENITFYVTVGNYLNRDFSFRVEILKGNNETKIGASGSSNATALMNSSTIALLHGENWISNAFNVSFSQPGS